MGQQPESGVLVEATAVSTLEQSFEERYPGYVGEEGKGEFGKRRKRVGDQQPKWSGRWLPLRIQTEATQEG
jgi:hypothetical protein